MKKITEASTGNIKKQLSDLVTKLKSHDWYYNKSDDNREYKQGKSEWNQIESLIGSLESYGAGKQAEQVWKKLAPADYKSQYPKPKTSTKKQAKYKFDGKGNVISVWNTWDQKYDSKSTDDIWIGSTPYIKDKKTGYWTDPHNNTVLTKDVVGKSLYETKQRIITKLREEYGTY